MRNKAFMKKALMMKIVLLLCFVAFYCSFLVQNIFAGTNHQSSLSSIPVEIKRTYYPDGRRKTEAQYEHGKLNGIFRQFYENGKLQLQREYKDDVLDGKSIEYYPNGKIKEEIAYRQGKILHIKLYDKNGKLILSRY